MILNLAVKLHNVNAKKEKKRTKRKCCYANFKLQSYLLLVLYVT